MISFMTKTVSWNVRSKYHETEEFRFLFRKLTCVAKTRVYVQDFLEKYGQPRNNYVERIEMNVYERKNLLLWRNSMKIHGKYEKLIKRE